MKKAGQKPAFGTDPNHSAHHFRFKHACKNALRTSPFLSAACLLQSTIRCCDVVSDFFCSTACEMGVDWSVDTTRVAKIA